MGAAKITDRDSVGDIVINSTGLSWCVWGIHGIRLSWVSWVRSEGSVELIGGGNGDIDIDFSGPQS